MPKFRKKPLVIEAVQFYGTPGSAAAVFEAFDIPGAMFLPSSELQSGHVTIPTLEGVMSAESGDWIIKGVVGEFYPCKEDGFEKTYEEVAEISPPIRHVDVDLLKKRYHEAENGNLSAMGTAQCLWRALEEIQDLRKLLGIATPVSEVA